jgi:hypothetical protein
MGPRVLIFTPSGRRWPDAWTADHSGLADHQKDALFERYGGAALLGRPASSKADDGRHLRGTSGWPYSIYRRATDIGVTDAVLCCGIQNLADAKALLALVNANVPVPIAKQLHDAA